MANGTRPGGLTALAVVNLVIGGLGTVGGLATLAALAGGFQPESEHALAVPRHWQYVEAGFSLAVGALLIFSGIGYLRQKKLQGRLVGNLYAVASLGSSALLIAVTIFTFAHVVGLVYPFLTLLLLNTTFKDDLVY